MSSDLHRELDPPQTTQPDNAHGLSLLPVPSHWKVVDVISDIHLDGHEPASFLAWRRYLETTPAQALLILGDLFEAWVGDDVLSILGALPNRHEGLGFEDRVIRSLRFASERLSLYFAPGNRDFLMGDAALAACSAQRLADPCVLALGDTPSQRVLLSHGDAWCTDDTGYMQLRSKVRSTAWQSDFLSKTLQERKRLAADMRAQSQAAQARSKNYADVNPAVVAKAAEVARCSTVIHGHTHEGKSHSSQHAGLPLQRHVTLDWTPLHDASGAGTGVRAQALRLRVTPQRSWAVDRVDL